ncbi:hypothetical protein BHE74_00032431 [Ensete ventricosum]|nr:hypothetical protein BHE74_00032431 [Ensete ventricosum]
MAAVTSSRFISRTSCSGYGGAFDSESMTFQSRRVPYLRTLATTYEGLRTRNVVDSRQMQLNAKATSRQARRGTRHASQRPWAIVVCGSGMNLVFVGAEVAPWSKTGGLGDVLGGLPPAMALKVGDRMETVRFFHCYKRGVDRVFVDHPMFLEKVIDWRTNGFTWFQVAFCIHNIAYQGRFAFSDFARLNLPDKFKSSFDFIDGYALHFLYVITY